jgi:hypothetical protein
MHHRFVCLTLLLLALLFATSSRADVIISEIMYNPQGSDTELDPYFTREYIELFNNGPTTMNLGGWQLGDAQDNTWADPFPSGTLIAPNEALVVTGDIARFDTQWGGGINRVEVGNFPTWANTPSSTNEIVAVRDGFDVIRDAVNYDDANGWPKTTGSDGQSIFLRPNGLTSTANDFGPNWAPSMWGAYGAVFRTADGENHGSPGTVITTTQSAFTPSLDAAWSMVVMPDTQNYAKSSADKANLTLLTEWIRDNREAYKIQVVLQEGDIVNNNDTNTPSSGDQTSTQQWQNVKQSFSVLDGHVPYILAAGNHDHGTTDAQSRQTFINDYFDASDNSLTDPAQGGILKGTKEPGEIQNAYYAFTAPDGRKMLIFALEWEPRPATVAWANQIAALPVFAEHTAAMVTHGYLTGNNTRYENSRVPADHSGEELWQAFVSEHENFEMTFNGHHGGDGAGYLVSAGDEGNTVHQMFLNTQFETHGGDGWLRVLEFLEDGTTVRVRTYSPLWDIHRTHSEFAFQFQISPLPASIMPEGDYNLNGVVDAADYVIWRKTVGTSATAADGFTDGQVNTLDYNYWRRRFGSAGTGGSGQDSDLVPEPSCLLMLVAGAFLIVLPRRTALATAAG